MYLWKIDKLVDDLRQDKVSQKEELKYLLVLTVLATLAYDPFLYIDMSYNYYDTLQSVLILGITVFGVYYCYQINSQGDNKEFIKRFFCLGLLAVVRISVVFVPLLLIGGILESIYLLSPEALVSDIIETTLVQAIAISLFVFVCFCLLLVSCEKDKQSFTINFQQTQNKQNKPIGHLYRTTNLLFAQRVQSHSHI